MFENTEAHKTFLAAHEAFLKRQFQDAADLFAKVLLIKESDKASKRFKELCEKYAKNPELAGDHFNVTVMTEK
jgi:hypothetical protein